MRKVLLINQFDIPSRRSSALFRESEAREEGFSETCGLYNRVIIVRFYWGFTCMYERPTHSNHVGATLPDEKKKSRLPRLVA